MHDCDLLEKLAKTALQQARLTHYDLQKTVNYFTDYIALDLLLGQDFSHEDPHYEHSEVSVVLNLVRAVRGAKDSQINFISSLVEVCFKPKVHAVEITLKNFSRVVKKVGVRDRLTHVVADKRQI